MRGTVLLHNSLSNGMNVISIFMLFTFKYISHIFYTCEIFQHTCNSRRLRRLKVLRMYLECVELCADVVQLITALITLYISRYRNDSNYINVVQQQHISGELKIVLFVIHIIIINFDMFFRRISISICSCSQKLLYARAKGEQQETVWCLNFLKPLSYNIFVRIKQQNGVYCGLFISSVRATLG